MRRRFCIYGIFVLLAASLLEGCAVVDTLVSQQYEIGPPYPWGNGCTSYVTGVDLCAALRRHKVLAGVFFSSAVGLLLGVIIADRRSA